MVSLLYISPSSSHGSIYLYLALYILYVNPSVQVMAGIIAIYGVVVAVLIAGELDASPKYTLYKGYPFFFFRRYIAS